MKKRVLEVLPYFPEEIRKRVEKAALEDWLEIEEIRLRTGFCRSRGCGSHR